MGQVIQTDRVIPEPQESQALFVTPYFNGVPPPSYLTPSLYYSVPNPNALERQTKPFVWQNAQTTLLTPSSSNTSNYISSVGTTATIALTVSGAGQLTANFVGTPGTVTSIGTAGLISGGPITTTGTITTSMATSRLVGRTTAGSGIMEEIALTTTGSSGAATLNAGALNIPTYSIAGLSPLTTKGDIFTFSTVNTRLGLGSDANLLMVDNAASTGNKWIGVSGDATLALTGVLTLANTTVSAGSYGSTTQVGTFTVDSKGRLTAASNSAISITGLGTALTKTDDTNVTLTLSGNNTTALVNTANIAVGWTGVLSVARGGTGSTGWTDYSGTTTIVGFSSTTTATVLYSQVGKVVFVAFYIIGTSNATNFTFTLPIAASASITQQLSFSVLVRNNGVTAATPGACSLLASSSTVSVVRDGVGTAFLNSGGKFGFGSFWYLTD